MMQTRNLPRPPPDDWQPAVKFAVAVLLSSTTFALVMVLAYVLDTVLVPWETMDSTPATNPRDHDKATVIVAYENRTSGQALDKNAVGLIQPLGLQGLYDEEVVIEKAPE